MSELDERAMEVMGGKPTHNWIWQSNNTHWCKNCHHFTEDRSIPTDLDCINIFQPTTDPAHWYLWLQFMDSEGFELLVESARVDRQKVGFYDKDRPRGLEARGKVMRYKGAQVFSDGLNNFFPATVEAGLKALEYEL